MNIEEINATLLLEDGMCFRGVSCGMVGEASGEICFNTSVVGYPEVISDPGCAGLIVVMTYPQIGNYGVARADLQHETLALRGLVVRDISDEPSSFRSDISLPELLVEQGVVAIKGVDTRALTHHIRDHGAQRAIISTFDYDINSLMQKLQAVGSIKSTNLVERVSTKKAYSYPNATQRSNGELDFILKPRMPVKHNIVIYDCGVTNRLLRDLHWSGCEITVLPWNTPATELLALKPDGVVVSGGPGDPEAVEETILSLRALLGKVPLFGVCLGYQMLSLAAGAQISKQKFGHRGGNYPVLDLRNGLVEITTQNHGFNLEFPSLGPLVPKMSGGIVEHPVDENKEPSNDMRCWIKQGIAPVVENKECRHIQLTHVNLNDGSPEGIAFLDIPACGVQFYPEATPGDDETHKLIEEFITMMDENSI